MLLQMSSNLPPFFSEVGSCCKFFVCFGGNLGLSVMSFAWLSYLKEMKRERN